MNDEIERHAACTTGLYIVGPQGSGKTTMARKIARLAGRFEEVDGKTLRSATDVLCLLRSRPRTIIIDGAPQSLEARNALKQIMSSKSVAVDVMFGATAEANVPKVIILDNRETLFIFQIMERRFSVIRLDGDQSKTEEQQ